MAIKIDDLYFTVKIDDSNITTVLNNTKKQMKELENVVLKSTDLDGEKLSHPFNMQALTIEQVINQMRLLEQTYKKIEMPDTNPAAEQMRQRWQDLQRQAEQYGITVRSALMEEATTADLLKHQSQLRSEIMAIVEKTGMIQSDTAKKIIEEQVALSTLKAERSKLNEAERMGIVSTDELSSAKARITAQEHQHKTAISQLEQQLRNEVKMNHTASGSMDELSLKLAKLRQEYRALSESARDGAIGKGMLKEITDLDGQLKGLDAGIGNYQRNIGNYASGFNGLQNAINQVGRELPSLKMGFGMFMLAISNNLPILSDELERARIRYKALKEEGLAAVPVWKQVLSALVSWQTVMVVGITLLTVYGKEISNWVVSLFKAKDGIMGLLDMQKAIDAEMSKSSGFGEQIVKLRDLQAQWDSFGDKIDEKKKFIEDNKSAFEDLGMSISNVGDAESALVTNTSSIIESLKLRAQAAAAYKLASEQYEKQLIKEREAEAESAKDASLWDKYRESALRGMMASEGGSVLGYSGATAEDFRKERIKDLKDEAKAAGEAGDAYFTLGEKALSAAGRISKTTTGKTTTSTAKDIVPINELRAVQDIQFAIEQARITAMKDGNEKTVEQMRLNHAKEMEQLKRNQEDALAKLVAYEKQKFEADPNNKGKKFDGSSVSLPPEQLAAFGMLEAATVEKQQAETDRYYQSILEKYKTYSEARLEVLKKYQSDREVILSQGADESKLNEVEVRQQEALDKVDEQFGQREESFKSWATSIADMSLKQLTDMLDKVKAQLESLESSGVGDSNEVALKRAQILKLTNEIETFRQKNKEVGVRGYSDWRKLSTVLNRVDKDLREIGESLGGTAQELITIAGTITTSTLSMIDGITLLSEQSSKAMEATASGAAKAMSAIEKASVILTIIAAALKVFDALKSIMPDSFNQYLDYSNKIAAINDMRTAVNEYELAVLEAEQAEKNWFGGDGLGGLVDAKNTQSKAMESYYSKLFEKQATYQNEGPGGWFHSFVKFGQDLANVVSGTTLINKLFGTDIGKWFGGDYEEGMSKAIDNLRIETRGQSSGFLGIGGKSQKTEDLISWTKKNLGFDLFDADGWINEQAYEVVMDKYGDKLVGQTKETLEALKELKEKYDEYLEQLREYVDSLYEPVVDNMVDALWDWLDSGKSALDSFKEYASDTFRAIVSDMMKSIILSKVVDGYQNDIAKLYEDYSLGKMTEEQLAMAVADRTGDLVDSYEKHLPTLEKTMESINKQFEKAGITLAQTESNVSKGQLESGIARATQDSIDVLAGGVLSNQGMLSELRNNSYALNIHISAQTNELKAQTAQLNLIRQYAMEVRDYNSRLVDIDENVATIVRRGVEIYG